MSNLLNQKNFNFLITSAVLLILVIPVGIANIYLGYFIGESPCTLCWNERAAMAIIGTLGIFILRYGLKVKYISWVFITAAYGLLMTVTHTSLDGFAWDVGMGFGTSIFGAHTYTWGVFVYWAVLIVMALLLIFLKNTQIAQDLITEDSKPKEFNIYSKFVVVISFLVVSSNAFQAFFTTGIPPFSGKGTPERFSLDISTADKKWTTGVWSRLNKGFSFTGKNVVDSPFVPGQSKPKKFVFNSNSEQGVIENLKSEIKIKNIKKLPFEAKGIFGKGNASTLAYNKKTKEFFIGSNQGGFYYVDENMEKVTSSAIIDKPNGYDIPLVVASTFIDNMLVSTAYNKTLVAIEKVDKSKIDSFKEWSTFRKTSGDILASWYRHRPVVLTVRAKKSYVLTLNKDTNSDFMYMLTVPNEVTSQIILIKIDSKDMLLSGESILKINKNLKIKSNRSIHEYYITASDIKDGKMLAVSKNFNTLLIIDLKKQEVVDAYKMPNIGDVSAIAIKDNSIFALTFKENQDMIYELESPF